MCILGDCHGDWTGLNTTIACALTKHPDITHIIQVGDFGYAWPGTKPFKFNASFLSKEQIKYVKEKVSCHFIDGNHENFTQLLSDNGAWQPGWTWQPRGSSKKIGNVNVLFFGGATSIDQAQRVEGTSWWREESITYTQIMRCLEMQKGPFDLIISHEHPLVVPFFDHRDDGSISLGDRLALKGLYDEYKPSVWLFGHHHTFKSGVTGDTLWACCPIVKKKGSYSYTIMTDEKIIYPNGVEKRWCL